MAEFEETIKSLRFHIEQEQKCIDTLLTLNLVPHVLKGSIAELREMLKKVRKGKSAQIAALDQLVTYNSTHPVS